MTSCRRPWVGKFHCAFLTQKERDSESGLDYFLARYYSSAQGRFTSVDPYNPIVDTEKEEFRKYLGQPENWNRYLYVWNNPLKYVDPRGEKVYVFAFTTDNKIGGNEELQRAAQTAADELMQSDKWDKEHDSVLVIGVKSIQDLQKAVDSQQTALMEKTYGRIEQVALFSHSGIDGPTFHRSDTGQSYQSPTELTNLRINWSTSATATFFACRSAVSFTQKFADAQGVPTFGYKEFAYFSAKPDKMIPELNPGGPVYLIAADYGNANGAISAARYAAGSGRVYPLVRRDPAPKDKPRK